MNREEREAVFTLGQFLGVTELYDKGLTTHEQFAKRCQEIAKEYEASKERAK